MEEEEIGTKSLRVPIRCPLCNYLMFGGKSTCSYYDFGVCVNCKIEFIEDGREERWRSGWRPDKEAISRYLIQTREEERT